MENEKRIIDVWMQHPNLEFINHPMFESLRRWMGIDKVTEEISVEFTALLILYSYDKLPTKFY